MNGRQDRAVVRHGESCFHGGGSRIEPNLFESSNAFRSYYILAANPHFLDHDHFDTPQGSTVINPRPSAAAEDLLAFSWISKSPTIQEEMGKALQGTANKAFEICTGNIEVCRAI